MYLANVKIQNFRLIQNMDLQLHKGLNILLGENDSGKTALLDAIRFVLGTRDFERIVLSKDDFFINALGRTENFNISLNFEGLSDEEAKIFLEWIGIKSIKTDGSLEYFLKVTLSANRKEINQIGNKYDREISYSINAGPDDVGISFPTDVKDLLRATYLKPLRDAEEELAARKGSRLSQILIAHPEIRQEAVSTDPNSIPGIVRDANSKVKQHRLITRQAETLNNEYLSNLVLGNGNIAATIDISDPSLKGILEHLKLTLTDNIPNVETNHGLGLNNLLFMATEMLLLGSTQNADLPLLLIEEPEAHLHPQLQIRLMEFLQQKTIQQGEIRPVQVIMTSHSPNLASTAGIENVILVREGKAFPLGPQFTCLNQGDYLFLQRFLDVTKSNLFFAKGVVVVEGDAEQILLPTIAKLVWRQFEKFGVSIVNVGSVGLFRYARIFQRQDGSDIGIRVACITDLDIPSEEAKPFIGDDRRTIVNYDDAQIEQRRADLEARASGGSVRTYVSPQWTLEYDLCNHHLGICLLVHQAISLAKTSKSHPNGLSFDQIEGIKRSAIDEFHKWQASHLSINQISTNVYKPLSTNLASKSETAQFLAKLLEEKLSKLNPEKIIRLFPDYIIEAIDYVTFQK